MPSVRAISQPRFKPDHPKNLRISQKAAPTTVMRWSNYLFPIAVFLATGIFATMIGMRYMYDFNQGQPPLATSVDLLPYRWDWNHLPLFASGLPFSITIVSILLASHFGRFYACRHFGVGAAIPSSFSAPGLSGSFRAASHTASRINSRSSLMAINAAGPIAGFAVAVATTCYGLVQSTAIGALSKPSLIQLSAPGIIDLLRSTMLASYPDIPPILQILPHPVLVASWIGILITAIKLIPAGRLNGGQIVYAISPRLHKVTSTIAIAALLYLGTTEWIGWLFAAALLIGSSFKSPRLGDESPVGLEWLGLAPICFTIFLLTASTQPIVGMNLVQVLLRIHWGLAIR